MPRDQETSFRNDPASSDDPLFREPSDRFRDGQVPSDQGQDDRDLADPNDTGATPIGDELTGRHTGSADVDEVTRANGTASGAVTDTPGEWVAGAKGPDYGTDTQAGHDVDAPLASDVGTPAGAGTRIGHDTPVDTDPLVPPSTTNSPATGVTEVPADTQSASVTPATPVSGAPGTAETPGVNTTSFVTNGDELHADWARIQSSFVDDPRGSVSQAADLVSQVTSSLVAAVQQREQTLRGEWESQEGTDTEHLRNALRDYRAYFELLVKL
jgi:hypothetical protein